MNERTIAERRQKYELICNPAKIFVETAFEEDSMEQIIQQKTMLSKHINYSVLKTR